MTASATTAPRHLKSTQADDRDAHDAVRGELDQRLVAQVLCDPSVLPRVLQIVSEQDLRDPQAAAVFSAILRIADAGREITLPAIFDDLDRNGGLRAIGGPRALAELSDLEATAVGVLDAARAVRRRSLQRREQVLHLQASQGKLSDTERAELETIESELAAIENHHQAKLSDLVYTGPRLESVRNREEPSSPLPGLFDPSPGLHVLVGQSSTGKTSLAVHLGQCWVCGAPPWRGAPPLPGSRCLVISREQSVQRIDRRARVLDVQNPAITRSAWTRRLMIVARDRDLSRPLRPLLRLDEDGLRILGELLRQAREQGDPIGLVILDSLSRLKPAETSESDNDDMSAWLDDLHGMAEETGTYFLLLHHKGHTEREGNRGPGRGASAIDAVAQATWDLRLVPGMQAFREVRVHGNAVDDSTVTFRVAPDEDPGKVLFWRLEGLDDALAPEDYLSPDEPITTDDLAWALSEHVRPPKMANGKRARPPRDAQIRAARARDRWVKIGAAEVKPGRHNSKLIRLAAAPQALVSSGA